MKKTHPAIMAVLIVLVAGGIGFAVWKVLGSPGSEPPAIVVRPDDPNDPKLRPDPRLGLAGGGGGGGANRGSGTTGSKASFLGGSNGQGSNGGSAPKPLGSSND